MARQRKRLGSVKRIHHGMAEEHMQSARAQINMAVGALRRGNCHGAFSHLMHAQGEIGASEAHGRSFGQTAWLPQRALMDLNGKFNDLCIVPDKVDVGAHWSPALAGKKRKRKKPTAAQVRARRVWGSSAWLREMRRIGWKV